MTSYFFCTYTAYSIVDKVVRQIVKDVESVYRPLVDVIAAPLLVSPCFHIDSVFAKSILFRAEGGIKKEIIFFKNVFWDENPDRGVKCNSLILRSLQ